MLKLQMEKQGKTNQLYLTFTDFNSYFSFNF